MWTAKLWEINLRKWNRSQRDVQSVPATRCRVRHGLALAGVVSLFWAVRLGVAEPTTTAPPALKTDSVADEQAATASAEASKIVNQLGIDDPARVVRVRDLIAKHNRGLRKIHNDREGKIAEAKRSPGADPTVLSAWVGVTTAQANIKLLRLHRWFVARLAAELTPVEVERVKNALTDNVVPTANNRYLQAFPNLTPDEKREILARLLEARDYAMDAGSAEERGAIFQKYQREIHDYLSQAGYDVKPQEHVLAVPD
jgi:hypothetical protein